jgi:hypothetical protein
VPDGFDIAWLGRQNDCVADDPGAVQTADSGEHTFRSLTLATWRLAVPGLVVLVASIGVASNFGAAPVVIATAIVGVCVVLAARATATSVTLGSDELVVRNLFRTERFAWKKIAKVEWASQAVDVIPRLGVSAFVVVTASRDWPSRVPIAATAFMAPDDRDVFTRVLATKGVAVTKEDPLLDRAKAAWGQFRRREPGA